MLLFPTLIACSVLVIRSLDLHLFSLPSTRQFKVVVITLERADPGCVENTLGDSL